MLYKIKHRISFILILWLSTFIPPQIIATYTQQVNATTPKPHPKYRNIIFDVGNVLLEWNPAKVVATVCTQCPDVKLDINHVLQFTGSQFWKNWDKGVMSRNEILQAASSAQINPEAFTKFLDLLPYSFTPLEDGIGILKTLKAKGYRIYVLSNMPPESLAVIKQQNKFFELCDGAVFSCNVHAAKPDFGVYQILLKEYQLDSNECLFLDDMPKNIIAAKAIGIDGIVCSSHAFVKDELKRLGLLN